ncbi:MAG TPA: RHS repeat-associated core domain-containing protein [Candidatus Limnocylindrales bacterium]|nr:RHS repeat-associated core domain-containing protein [Candidatus Limnocylindrales bacterium]
MRSLSLLCALALAMTPALATSTHTTQTTKPAAVDAALASAWRTSPSVVWPGKTPGVTWLERVPGGARLRVDGGGKPAPIELDYSGFRWAFGGDWASRLRLWDDEKHSLVPIKNDPKTAKLTATVVGGGYTLSAGASGSAGSFQPTPLNPSATWQTGLSGGDFAWSYPLSVPQLPGRTPSLKLSYSSGGVDGRTASTNNQPSPVGEGFELRTGYIERSYQPCPEDGQSRPDLCWASYNATLVMPGLAGELVRDDASKTWRVQQDEGWRVELLSSTTNGNGDNDGEYWKLTAPDGVQYFFGRNRMPGWVSGSPETNAAYTVPVYGDDPDEPCEPTWCQQAWRWNLDFVVDPHGDTMVYYYDRETNYYARQGVPTGYVRSGQLARIEYGLRADAVYAAAPGRVVLTPGNRCLAEGPTCVSTQPQNWPDVPLDQACGASACSIPVPTFWSTKRLAKITTQVLVNGAYRDMDSYALTHIFPDTGDGTSPALWLFSIIHSGHTSGMVSLPPVTFAGVQRENRLDATGGHPVMNKWRVETITTETGGRIKVTYALKECQRTGLPTPDDNRLKCFPVWWDVTGAGPTLDWFNKYVVTQVSEEDPVGGAPPKLTQYEYLDPGAVLWHHDDAELTPARWQSWGSWRGYARVRVRSGLALTEYLFLRGLHDDLLANGSRRVVRVGGLDDIAAWRGFGRSETVYNGASIVSQTISEPLLISATATRARPSGPLVASLADEVSVRVITTLAAGGTRTAETRYGYDTAGRLTRVSDLTDNTCVTTTYADNVTDWIRDRVSLVQVLAVGCDTTPVLPGDLITEQRNFYDRSDVWGSAPSKGDLTRVDRDSLTVSRIRPDTHGRPLDSFDAMGKLTTTAYTPAVGGPLTRTVVTNPLGHSVSTDFDPGRSVPLAVTDANQGVTATGYDAFGRVAGVWLPGRATSLSANYVFRYQIRADGPTVVTTSVLQGAGSYRTTHQLYDGLGRPLQTQEPSPAGGRIVTDTRYDSRGLVERTIGPRPDPSPPDTALAPAPAAADRETRYSYDGAGRVTTEALYTKGAEKWRTSTSYGGDRITLTPPGGGTVTTKVFDAKDRVVELYQQADLTRMSYTKLGRPATVTDPAGNIWRYIYDSRQRLVRAEAPDTGVRSWTYDNADRVKTSTDGRGRALTHNYDDLGRRTSLYEGTTKLAQWVYDTAANGLGLLGSATRFAGANAYTTAPTGYDLRGRRLGTAVTIPAAETGLAGTYTTGYAYNEADQVTRVVTPAAGGVAAETLVYGYDALGYPATLAGQYPYVADSTRDELGEPAWLAFGDYGRRVYRTFERDPATGRLTRATTYRDHPDTPTLAEVSYGYDPAGNVTSIVDAPDGATVDAQCFQYDYLRRLAQAWTPSGSCATAPSLSGLAGAAKYWHVYTYDRTDNRLTEVQHSATGDVNRGYSYPAGHRLASVSTNGSAALFGYDAAGNLTSAAGRTFTWDVEGRLASTSDSSYVYDADGNRLIRRDGTGVTLYLGDTEVRRASGGTLTATRYYRFEDTVVATRTGTQLRWLFADHHGTNEIAVADQAGLPATVRRSLPFGGPRGSAPANWPGDKGFVGGIMDPTGLTHLGAREYDPATGRFVSVDPIVDHRDPQQVNGYAYGLNNPATFSDPDGLKPKPKKIDQIPKKVKPSTSTKPKSDPVIDEIIANMDYDYELCSWYGITCPPGWEDGAEEMCKWYSCDNMYVDYSGGAEAVEFDDGLRPCAGWDECIDPRPSRYQLPFSFPWNWEGMWWK